MGVGLIRIGAGERFGWKGEGHVWRIVWEKHVACPSSFCTIEPTPATMPAAGPSSLPPQQLALLSAPAGTVTAVVAAGLAGALVMMGAGGSMAGAAGVTGAASAS